jgi:Mn-dependent DtxR family transcriptional regulator
MDIRNSPLADLEKFGMLEMILFLFRKPNGIQRVDYLKELQIHNRSMTRNHDILFERGIVENVPHPKELRFRLTEKGKKIAEHILEIKKLME